MAGGKEANSGCAGVIGIVLVIGLISMIPVQVWIGLGIAAGVAVVVWIGKVIAEAVSKGRAESAAAEVARRREQEAAIKRQRIAELGATNAQCVETALAAVQRVADSEAAREGWLGDVDFDADIAGIVAEFRRVHELREVAGRLGALDDPSADDRRLLDEARTTASSIEQSATGRALLIFRCADEARQIDESLRREREEAQTAQQRAQLHAELNAMLYGAASSPQAAAADSAADRVMARVAGYREIKQQIIAARDGGV